jgi:hypothetical protein
LKDFAKTEAFEVSTSQSEKVPSIFDTVGSVGIWNEYVGQPNLKDFSLLGLIPSCGTMHLKYVDNIPIGVSPGYS